MSRLAPDLFKNRRYADLVEIGRARLPGLAPDWTDHNAHDPGITLMELLAWVAEAQVYSLSRTRRDERQAYAALLGLVPGGTRPARGLIWADRLDPQAPAAIYASSRVIPADAVVHVLNCETPTFRPLHRILWAPGRVTKLETRLADGSILDHTASNERGGASFLPLGETAGPRDILSMEFECRDDDGMFPTQRKDAEGAHFVIGVRADATTAASSWDERSENRNSPLVATLVHRDDRFPLEIVADSTDGLLQTGALVLDVSRVAGSPQRFSIELRSPRGIPRPPRLLRIEPNVVPVSQGRLISAEHEAPTSDSQPDFNLDLDMPGLRFAPGEDPIRVEVKDATGTGRWERRDRLSECGPNDRVYAFDATAGRVTFGNGINGSLLSPGAKVCVSYGICDGERGNVARNRKWQVSGFSGSFGENPDPIAGGSDRLDFVEQRREARRRSRQDHALVSSHDIEEAARALPLLEVARAWVLPPPKHLPRTGVITLVAMRARPSGREPDAIPETPRWLDTIRRRLAGHMPLGARLAVIAPRYVTLSVRAKLETDPGRDPTDVKNKVIEALDTRLVLVASESNSSPRAPGAPVTQRDVAAWMRAVDGVARITDLRLVLATGKHADEIKVPRSGLPKLDRARSAIDVVRSETGRAS